MKLFERTSGHWLFWTSAVYLTAGAACAFYFKEVPAASVQLFWLTCLLLPFAVPSFGRWLNLDIEWDRKMFDWFKNKSKDDGKIVPFPEVPSSGYSAPVPLAEKEKPAVTYYRLGITSDNRVSFQMGYSEITMNAQGVQNIIDQLEFFKKQIQGQEEHNETE